MFVTTKKCKKVRKDTYWAITSKNCHVEYIVWIIELFICALQKSSKNLGYKVTCAIVVVSLHVLSDIFILHVPVSGSAHLSLTGGRCP